MKMTVYVQRDIEVPKGTDADWPKCYYDSTKFCGEQSEASIEPGWTLLCRCPSYPVKVAASAAAGRARGEAK